MISAIYKIFFTSKNDDKIVNKKIREICKQKKYFEIRKLFKDLKNINFNIINNDKYCIIDNNININKELIVRQLVIESTLGQFFFKKLIISKATSKPLIHPLPKEYLNCLKEIGYNVSFFRSLILWYLFVTYRCLNSIPFLFYFFFKNLVYLNNKKIKHFNNSVFFVDLNNKNLPNENFLEEPSNNIFEWYRANYNYVKTIYHNLEKFKNIKYNIFETNIYYNNLIPYLKFKKLITLFFYSLLLFFYSLFTLFIGKWWNAIILKDKFTYLIFKYADDIMLSNDYLFSNSSINYRPLWTYVLESRNKNIIMYFYSVSDQPLCPSLNTSTFNIFFPNINWPIYYCWDKFQSNQIKQLKYSKNSKFYEFGSIYFESNHKNLPKLPNKFIAVFDFEPHKTEFYVGYGTYYDLGYNFNKEISNRLLSDVIEIADKLNIKVIHKAKRDIGSKRTKSYSELLNNLTKYKNYISLNPSYNAYSIIQKSTIVISQPFTSTALMSKSVNKNSIYYDPLALINKFDPAKRDIVIIQSKKNLYNYIKNNY